MARAARGGARASRAGAIPYLYLAPAITLFCLFVAVPIGYTVYLSLRRAKFSGLGLGKGSRKEVFVGLDNYRAAISDGEFWAAWVRVITYAIGVLTLMLGLALVFALLLDSATVRFGRFSRIAIFLPYAVPAVVATLLWGF